MQEQYQRLQEMQKRKEESSATSKTTGPIDDQLTKEDYDPPEIDKDADDRKDSEDNGDASIIT